MPLLTPVLLRRLGPNRWRLLGPLLYRGHTDLLELPAGRETDGASVPWWSAILTPRTGRVDVPAFFHDEHCRQLAAGTCPISSVDTDGLFRRMLREEGMGAVQRWLYWTGVRWGALANPARRPGWARTAPAVLACTTAGLAALAGGLGLLGVAAAGVLRLLGWL